MSFICDICNKKCKNKQGLVHHKNWHNPEFKKSHSGENANRFGKHLSDEHKRKILEANKGKKHTLEHRRKNSEAKKGENHPNWRGDNVGYQGIHTRVRKVKSKPENCEICGLPEFYENLGRIELSNIQNHQYTDNPDDYQYVHHSCHAEYDNLF